MKNMQEALFKNGISSYFGEARISGQNCEHDSIYLPESDIPFSAHLKYYYISVSVA